MTFTGFQVIVKYGPRFRFLQVVTKCLDFLEAHATPSFREQLADLEQWDGALRLGLQDVGGAGGAFN